MDVRLDWVSYVVIYDGDKQLDRQTVRDSTRHKAVHRRHTQLFQVVGTTRHQVIDRAVRVQLFEATHLLGYASAVFA